MSSTPDEDIGTVRWFGPTWNAPINDPRAEVTTPIDLPCERCDRGFVYGDKGITIPCSGCEGIDRVAYHLSCWLRELGLDVGKEVYGD